MESCHKIKLESHPNQNINLEAVKKIWTHVHSLAG